ncbi:MAG: hypothetical protein ACRD98_08590 [Nitrososphaera sp.]
MRTGKKGTVKQLANKSINYSAFLTATLIPTVWLLFANLVPFILRNEHLLQHHRLAALATGMVWGCIVAWATNVPQVLYFYRPGGRNKAQRRLFVTSALGLLTSLSALVLLGVVLMSSIADAPLITYTLLSLAIIGLLPIIRGCARSWRYIYITDPRGVYIAYTGQTLQPNTHYRTGLTWKTPALEHHLEFEENKIRHIRFKDGAFELRYSATVEFPETPIAPDDCKMDPIALSKAASAFLLEQLQRQCARFTGMQCMKMQPGLRPVEEYVPVAAITPRGYEIHIRMRWSGKFKLSDTT